VASAAQDGTIKVWDITAGRELHHLESKGVVWQTVALIGQTLAAAGGETDNKGLVEIWDTSEGRSIFHYPTKERVRCLALSPTGQEIGWAGLGGEVHLVDVHSQMERAVLDTGMKRITWIAFSSDGLTLAVAGTGSGVKLWDVESTQERASLPGHSGGACFAGFSKEGTLLVTAGVSGVARLWWRIKPQK
jgi:WD40 repeat protein